MFQVSRDQSANSTVSQGCGRPRLQVDWASVLLVLDSDDFFSRWLPLRNTTQQNGSHIVKYPQRPFYAEKFIRYRPLILDHARIVSQCNITIQRTWKSCY